VPGPEGGAEQGVADQGDGVAAARQQPGVEHDVGDSAAAAPRPVGRTVISVPPRSRTVRSRACPHGRITWPQAGQASLPQASSSRAAWVSRTSIIVHAVRIAWPSHAGIGFIDPDLARDLAAGAARNPRSTWCLTVTEPTRYPI
jgi:hypothetical protein